MPRSIHFPIAVVAALLAWGCEGDTVVRPDAEDEDRIHVSGSAELSATPDVAEFTLGVQTFDADAVAAVTRNNERAAAVLAALGGLGVADADLQTTSFSISPQRAYAEDRPDSISGFWVHNTVLATLRDVSLAGTALQAAIDAGANQVYGLRYTLSDPDSLEDEARRLAVLDARRRAGVMAAAAGAEVGRVISLSESSVSAPYYRSDAAYDGAEGVPVTPGDIEITAQVTAVFALE